MKAQEIFESYANGELVTPCYVYDLGLLKDTCIEAMKQFRQAFPYSAGGIYYAVKSNHEPRILSEIATMGFGADTVSIGEVRRAVEAGFKPADIVLSGVGKSADEIAEALALGIGCINAESLEELDEIAEIAAQQKVSAPVALRLNPDIDARTHKFISTGKAENKFGINLDFLDEALEKVKASEWIDLQGFHLHIGSQITEGEVFRDLGAKATAIYHLFVEKGFTPRRIDLGGGLGVDYAEPDRNPVADFRGWFRAVASTLEIPGNVAVYFEPGRAVSAQCGSIISKVIRIKKGVDRQFAILDAGFNNLLRPALYQANHKIQKLDVDESTVADTELYDVVGPVCESSDVFAVSLRLPVLKKGDLVAIRSAGAYGSSMHMAGYNSRTLQKSIFFKK